jgi:predicted transcriptional regulator
MVNGKEKSLLLQLTGEMPLFRIIDFLIENKSLDFTKKQISEGSGIARASLFNYWPELEKHGIVKATRKFGKTVLYTLNSENLIVKRILDLEKVLIATAMTKAQIHKKVLVPA